MGELETDRLGKAGETVIAGQKWRAVPTLRSAARSARLRAMILLKIAAGLALIYPLVVGLLALGQDSMLFPRWAMGGGATALPASAERLTLATPDGETLVGVHLPADPPPPEDAALILGFGGNAWDADALAMFLRRTFPARDVVTFHYRGYGPSTGRPSAGALLDDAILIHDEIVARLAPARITAVGLSLGAGPATHLADRRPIAGLVLVTPFDSLEALAREHYPWAPVGLLLRHRMDIAAALAATDAPVAIIAAERDTIVPPRRTAPLRELARNLVLDRVIEGADHNDLYGRLELVEAMREALRLIEG